MRLITLKIRKTGLCAAVSASLFAGALWPAGAAAEGASPQTAAAPSGQFEEIVVTARKREEQAQQVPIAITAFTQLDLYNKGIKTLADVGYYSPSVYIQSDVFQQDILNITIRGQQNFPGNGVGNGVQFDTATAVYMNGVYLARTQGLQATLFDIDDLEILKGPQGTLVGRNSTGGAVLFTTREPQSQFGGYLNETLGDYGREETQGVLNVPVTDQISLRAGLSYSLSDGWLKNIYVDPASGDRNGTPGFGYKKLSGLFSAKWTPDDSFKLVLRGDFDTEHDSGTGYHDLSYFIGTVPSLGRSSVCNIPGSCTTSGAPAGTGFTDLLGHYVAPYYTVPATPRSPGSVNPNPAAYNALLASLFRQQGNFWTMDQAVPSLNDDHVHDVSVTADKDFNGFHAKWVGGYRWFSTYDISASRGDPYDVVQTAYLVPNYKSYTSDLTLNGDALGNRVKWTAGAFFFEESAQGGDAQYVYSPNFQRPAAVSGRQVTLNDLSGNSGRNDSYALYAQATYSILPELRLTGGVRYSIDDRSASIVSTTTRFPATPATNATVANSVFNPGNYVLNGIAYPGYSTSCAIQNGLAVALPLNGCKLDVAKEFREPTWVISIDYDLFDKTMLYFTTRKGYKSGAINEGLKGSNVNLLVAQPETVQDYELGIKSDWNFLTMPVRSNVDVYYTDYENIQTQISLPFVALAVGPNGGPCTQTAFNTGSCTGTQAGFVMVNAKAAEVFGVEWDLEAKPIPPLALTWGGSYLRAYYTDFSFNVPAGYLMPASGAANLSGTPFPVPQWQINASATYTWDGAQLHLPVDQVSLAGQWYWQGTTLADYAGFQYPAMVAKSYLFTNLRLNVENIDDSNVSMSAFVTNLFDTRACEPETNGTINSVPNATFGAPNTSGVVQCVPLPPRMFGVNLHYAF